ncbi:MAG: IS3 family transposase [Chitinophagaceae bacterium]|nr:IS3 family transposase [Oligoflexus sp.]
MCAIARIHQGSRQTYGSPRMHEALITENLACSPTRVERRMKSIGIRTKTR